MLCSTPKVRPKICCNSCSSIESSSSQSAKGCACASLILKHRMNRDFWAWCFCSRSCRVPWSTKATRISKSYIRNKRKLKCQTVTLRSITNLVLRIWNKRSSKRGLSQVMAKSTFKVKWIFKDNRCLMKGQEPTQLMLKDINKTIFRTNVK